MRGVCLGAFLKSEVEGRALTSSYILPDGTQTQIQLSTKRLGDAMVECPGGARTHNVENT